jgi:membrane-associated protease RseP (regulator of RpoE activity)
MPPLARKLTTALLVLASAAAFFWLALSTLPNEVKLPALLLVLYLSGEGLKRATGLIGYGPFLLWKGKGGFSLMHHFARHPRFFREFNDFGLSLCFGLPYGWYLFRGQMRKLLAHAVLCALLFYWLQMGVVPQFENLRGPLLAVGLLAGLWGFGLLFVILHAWTIATTPSAPAGVMPVVPGITIPFAEGLIAIFIAAVAHELSHGVIALVERLRVESSGGIFLGFLPVGAFVEPDEEQFKRTQLQKKRRVLVAGSAANFAIFLLAVPVTALLAGVTPALLDGIRVHEVNATGASAGVLSPGDLILAAGGRAVKSTLDLSQELARLEAGDVMELRVQRAGGETTARVRLGENKRLGVTLENLPRAGYEWLLYAAAFLLSTVALTGFLNFALSTVNILPLFITDGHRLLYEELLARLGPKREHDAKLLSKVIGFATLALLLVNALPLLR